MKKTEILLVITAVSFMIFGVTIGSSIPAQGQQASIPSWIKNTAKLWSEGQISDADYLKSIQWLLDQKILVLSQSAQSTTTQSTTIPPSPDTSGKYITNSNFYLVSANPDNYKYQWAQLSGKVSKVEAQNNKVAILLDLDKPLQFNLQNIVWVVIDNDSTPQNQPNDCIYVEGSIQGSMTGQNLFGGSVSNVWMSGDKVQTISCLDAYYPALQTINVNQVQTIGSAQVTLEDIEFADDHTRAKIKVENLSQDKNVNIYSFNDALVQGQSQFQSKSVFGTGSKDLDTTILPGVVEEGYVYFEPAKPGSLKVILDITSDIISDQKFTFNVS